MLVQLAGELDMSTMEQFREKLCLLAGSVDADTVVLDVTELNFISAGCIRVLLSTRDTMAARGRVLRVGGLHGMPARVFDVLGLESLLYRPSGEAR
ncbi:STAS domain-containing protein [Pseudonocardia sp. Cha107L01]|uniref:STAS domain-containing protein n=1 Tax=Pseudonocardia sp. Cha107L01 TaxID=3457576 RepID=UPI00403EF1D6